MKEAEDVLLKNIKSQIYFTVKIFPVKIFHEADLRHFSNKEILL